MYPETGAETRFNAPRGTTVDAAAETFYENGTSLKGRVTGDITKGSLINLRVTRGPKYPALNLSGDVAPNNTGQGAFQFEDRVDMQNWESPTRLACVPGAPPPVADQLPKPDGPKPVTAEQQNPAPQGLGSATVIADTDIYDKPDGRGQISARCSPGKCIR